MKVLVAMSGGVDSSVAAQLLTGQGHTCIGCTMKLYGNEDAGLSKGTPAARSTMWRTLRSVAYRLGMPYYVFNFCGRFPRPRSSAASPRAMRPADAEPLHRLQPVYEI